MYRTLVIVRYTFLEAVMQPIFSLLLAIGACVLVIFGLLPFFTLGEDTLMFKSVGLDVILILVLLSTLFATSKSIFDEIEDRTMLTLMSKPVKRWEVMVGKYLGIILSSAVGVALLGIVLALCTWLRVPGDYQMRPSSLNDLELRNIFEFRLMNVAGLLPSLLLLWMQIAVLAAVGVALSTRVSLVVNLPIVIILYIAGNLTQFLFPIFSDQAGSAMAGRSDIVKCITWFGTLLLPYLHPFDLRELTVMRRLALPGTQFVGEPHAVAPGVIIGYLFVALLYAVSYITFALSAGMWLFQTRELGGGES